MIFVYHINQDGTGDYPCLTKALADLSRLDLEHPEHKDHPVTFMIHPGIYRERITITRPFVTLVGTSAEETVLTYDLYARMPMEDIGKLGTFRSYSVMIDADDFTARNLTFENSSGSGPEVGQALAMYADGDRLVFDRCRFLGGQDTLFTAPLPPAELEANGFIGPKQTAPRITGRHYYKACFIEGDIDFIFGGATAYFEECEFFSKFIDQNINSYVTAASTPEGQKYGYVMERCCFTGNCPAQTAFLGRPWREFAKTVLLNCYIGSHICAEGWHDWGKTDAHDTVFYAEYQSHGPAADMTKRPAWIRHLTPDEAMHFTRELVLGGTDHWNP